MKINGMFTIEYNHEIDVFWNMLETPKAYIAALHLTMRAFSMLKASSIKGAKE